MWAQFLPNFVWQVWGCGTFGVNKTELGMFYDQYCSDCDLTDVQYDTIHHGVEHGDNFMEVCITRQVMSDFSRLKNSS